MTSRVDVSAALAGAADMEAALRSLAHTLGTSGEDMTMQAWILARRWKRNRGRRNQTVYVFWRHWDAPDLWQGVQRLPVTGGGARFASRPRS